MAALSAVSNELITDRTEGPARPSPDPKASRNHNTEKNGSGENPAVNRRGSEKNRATKGTETASNARFFLTKRGSNGKPELGDELADENEALIEALKRDGTFAIVTEWAPTVDSTVEGRPVIGKQAAPRSEMDSL